MIKNFVSLDFETSSGKNPCSIGIVEFKEGKVIDKYYSLIKPKDLNFNPFTSRIHGISMLDVIEEREFDEVWKDISHFFDNKTIVAHNCSFDIAVLNYSFDIYEIEKPNYDICCTLKLSRLYLDLENYKLNTVANFFDIKQDNYHNALEDALVCGKAFLNLMNYADNHNELKVYSNKKVKKKRDLNYLWKHKEEIHRDKKFVSQILNLKSNKLESQKFVITGVFQKFYREELKKSIEDNGGKVASSISKKTTFVIAGENMGPSKLVKAETLGVSIISESDYLKMLE